MLEIAGDIWKWGDFLKGYIVIPTNGYVKSDGCAVMGRGLARQAAFRYPELPKALGKSLQKYGNRVYIFEGLKIITFPVKHNWWEKADLKLIETSAIQLREAIYCSPHHRVLIPRVGCGNGKLDWEDVKPILEATMREVSNIIICHPEDYFKELSVKHAKLLELGVIEDKI